MTVKIADLPQVKATLEESGRRLREQESTIQRLIAQADALAKTVTELAFQAWHGTQRCGDCRFANAVRMGQGAYCGRCLQVIDALTAAGFGESMREWAGA
jgi:hypothetical protein